MMSNETAEKYKEAAFDFSLLRMLADEIRIIGKRVKQMQYTTNFHDDGKLVSDADLYAQAQITACIERHLPYAVIIAEEGFTGLPKMDEMRLVFMLDPIDGTRYYLSGKDEWAISLGIYKYGALKGAIVLQPAYDECFIALENAGIEYRKGRNPWQKHERRRARRPLIGVSTSVSVAEVESSWRLAGMITREFRAVFSAPTVTAFLEVLRGRSDACIMLYEPKLWDVAAILLLALESNMLVGVGDGLKVSGKSLCQKPVPRLIIASSEATFFHLCFVVSNKY